MSNHMIIQEVHDILAEIGCQSRLISIKHIDKLQKEFEKQYPLINQGLFDRYLKGFNFNPFEQLSNANSIILVAYPQPPIQIYFNWDGKKVPLIFPPTYPEIISTKKLKALLEKKLKPNNYSIAEARLPKKLLAVHSGLAKYGKNNITYIPEMGSFYHLDAFYSNLPYEEDSWFDLQVMERCDKCNRCIRKCPASAIPSDRFLLRAERCITYHNEKPGEIPFPDWIDPSWHNSIIGCMICQRVCPENKSLRDFLKQGREFDEKETALLSKGIPITQLPNTTVEKLQEINLINFYDQISRNLSVFINHDQIVI